MNLLVERSRPWHATIASDSTQLDYGIHMFSTLHAYIILRKSVGKLEIRKSKKNFGIDI